MESNESDFGLAIAVIANDTLLSEADVCAMMPMLAAQ
jgi:hypothetical protein